VQVGTSSNSTVSSGTDYAFTSHLLRSAPLGSAVSHWGSSELPVQRFEGVLASPDVAAEASSDRSLQVVQHLVVSRDPWVPIEVRKDDSDDVVETSCLPLHGVISWIRSNRAAAEILSDELEDLVISVLADRGTWPHFPSDPDLGSRADRDGEASFTIEIAGDVRRDVDRIARARVLRRP